MTAPTGPDPTCTSRRRFVGRPGVVAVVAVLVLVAGACGDDAATSDGADVPIVVATTSIWADVVSNLTCDGLARVEILIPVGADPHAFEPSLADRGEMEDARLVVANGLLLEAGLENTLEAVEQAGTAVFRFGDHVAAMGSDDDGGDPHIWFDPVRVADAIPDLEARLVDDVGLDAGLVGACTANYLAELAAVDAEIVEMVAAVPASGRLLVTSHDSLGYFADRYGFEVVGTVIPAPSTLAETNPADLERLAELIEASGVKAIFAETQHSTDDADALADEVGDIEVVTLLSGTLGPPGSGSETYLGFLRTNAESVTGALQ